MTELWRRVWNRGVDHTVSGVALADDGQIYAAGASLGLLGATALGSDGSVNQAFGTDGLFATRIGEIVGGYGDMLRRANKGLLIAGPSATDCRHPVHPLSPDRAHCHLSATVVALDSAGALDAGFGDGGVARIPISRSRKSSNLGAGRS